MNAGQIMQLRDLTRLLCDKPHLRYRSVPRVVNKPLRPIVEPVEHKRIREVV